MADNGSLKSALGLSLSALSAEHLFSAGLSSPWSVAKFTQSADDARIFWKLFWEAAGFSLLFALIIGKMLDEMGWALAGTGGIVAWMWYDYKRAIAGEL